MSQYDEFEEQGSQKFEIPDKTNLETEKKSCQNQNNIDNVTM